MQTEKTEIIPVPELDGDKRRPPDGGVKARCMVERAVVFALLLHLSKCGFEPFSVDDGGGEWEAVTGHKEVMESVFAVDDAKVRFKNSEYDRPSGSVYFVMGNDGWDIINDYSWRVGDLDGFQKAMDAFDPEKAVVMGVIGVTA
jgi:hypothetical protein